MSLEEHIFQEATKLLGGPINDWQFKAIEFNDDGPYLRYYPEDGVVTICLSPRAKEDTRQYCFQLTHEICHLFYPKIEYPSLKEHRLTVLNEGISTYFSIKLTGLIFNIEDHLKNDLMENSKNYYNAFGLVEKLLLLDEDAIRKLRAKQPRVDLLTANDFEKANVDSDSDLITNLLKYFD